MQDTYNLIMRYLSQKERDAIPDEDFAGPHRSFPVRNQDDVDNDARLLGHAKPEDQAEIKRNIIRLAKKKGLKLPESWQEEEDGDKKEEDRATMGDAEITMSGAPHPPMTGKHSHSHPHMDGYSHEHEHEHHNDNMHDHAHTHAVARAASPDHEPMTGTHSHAHPAFGSQGDDEMHTHEHTHANDNDHKHSHDDRAQLPTTAMLYAPITRIDTAKREVEGVATSEAVDSFGTIFSYEASKAAFKRWIERTANVREMHTKTAVGKGIGVFFDDANKQIIVRSRVSRSADGENTWTKIREGILNGYSVGATNPVWDTIERNGKTYPYLTSYELAELSYVDNASNPDAQGLVIARADGLTALVDISDDALQGASHQQKVERAGARVSNETKSKLHDARNGAITSAMKMMETCGCPECEAASKLLDPDQDGDIDLGGLYDPDGDSASVMARAQQGLTAEQLAVITGAIERAMQPVYQRQQAVLARMTSQTDIDLVERLETLETRIATALERATAPELATVPTELAAIKEQVERIAAQPSAGGPVLNGYSVPVEKRLAIDPVAMNPLQGSHTTPSYEQLYQGLNAMQAQGDLQDQQKQLAAAALMLVQQQQQQSGNRR